MLKSASLFNHSSQPNVNFIRKTKDNTIRFLTAKRVKAGEELVICYSADESKLWFVDTTKPAKVEMSDDEDEETLPMVSPEDLYDVEENEARRAERAAQTNHHNQACRRSTSAGKSSTNPTVAVTPSSEPESSGSSSNIIAPQPVHYAAQQHPIPQAPAQSSSSTLPPPLHSTPTPSPNTPPDLGEASLVPDLEWRTYESKDTPVADGEAECVRIWGPADIADRDEQEGFSESFFGGLRPNAYESGRLGSRCSRATVNETSLEVRILHSDSSEYNIADRSFTKDQGFTEVCMKHLKRVTRKPRPDGQGQHTSVALCTVPYMSFDDLSNALAWFNPALASLVPRVQMVPRSSARNQAEAKEKNAIWPVALSPHHVIPQSSSSWTAARLAWVKAGVDRVLSLALEAKARGEVPVGVFCAAPPEPFWALSDGFIPPTEGLRAQATDTRVSANHPLRHAILNCVRAIAHLRTVSPFSTAVPTRNGADYLLTSLTLFVTHEPCVMCAMALIHSRVKEVFYIFPRTRGGGFHEGGKGIHGRKDLNHRFDVWRYDGYIDPKVREALDFDSGTAV